LPSPIRMQILDLCALAIIGHPIAHWQVAKKLDRQRTRVRLFWTLQQKQECHTVFNRQRPVMPW
jgi:hypothetical protein